jgi:Lar family restriction alleviation protein
MKKLLPCPFCGGEAGIERTGTPRQSCIVACVNCGARHESGDEAQFSGASWNRRTQPAQLPKLTDIEALRIGAMHSEAGSHDRSFTADDFLAAVRDIEAALIAKWSKT